MKAKELTIDAHENFPRQEEMPLSLPKSFLPSTSFNINAKDKNLSLETLLEITPEDGRPLVTDAYNLAMQLHQGVFRASGEPYITHPLIVAHYLAELRMDSFSIAAGLLHDILEDTEFTREELLERFPESVVRLVEGVTKLSKINFRSTREAQIENLRTMIVAMARDIRVIIVKLCDRLHNVQTLGYLEDEKRRRKAQETLDIYAPLANRLGIYKLRTLLEDHSMRWLNPEEYQFIAGMVAKQRAERESHVAQSVTFLQDKLGPHFENVHIYGRPKHFHSIWRKMQSQGLTFDQIYDLNAIRVVCENLKDCYSVLGLIHSVWKPVPGRFKDYIATPKKNHYQSLHTTVVGLQGEITEIQIRTREMHQTAEYGIAAHWKYKEQRRDDDLDQKLLWLRQLTEWITEAKDPDDFLDGLKQDVFADVVMCFTPKGDVYQLPAGATPIDFAYQVHTEVGDHCVSARVNKRMVNLRSTLSNGDVVDIVTSAHGHPSRDWLRYIKTARARAKIKRYLKSQDHQSYVKRGKESIKSLIDQRNIDVSLEKVEAGMKGLLDDFKLLSVEDMYAEIGFGSLSAPAILYRINKDWSGTKDRKPRPRRKILSPSIKVQGLEDIAFNIAKCCQPIAGEDIVAYTTRGRGVTIHREDCKSIARIVANDEERLRLLPAEWQYDEDTIQTVCLRISALNRLGLLSDISGTISSLNININASNSKPGENRQRATLYFEVNVGNATEMKKLMDRLRDQQEIVRVDRVPRMPQS